MSMQEMLNPHSISRKFFFLKQATEANNRYKLHGKIEICFIFLNLYKYKIWWIFCTTLPEHQNTAKRRKFVLRRAPYRFVAKLKHCQRKIKNSIYIITTPPSRRSKAVCFDFLFLIIPQNAFCGKERKRLKAKNNLLCFFKSLFPRLIASPFPQKLSLFRVAPTAHFIQKSHTVFFCSVLHSSLPLTLFYELRLRHVLNKKRGKSLFVITLNCRCVCLFIGKKTSLKQIRFYSKCFEFLKRLGIRFGHDVSHRRPVKYGRYCPRFHTLRTE